MPFQSEEQKALLDRENLPLSLPLIQDLRETNNARNRLKIFLSEVFINDSDSEMSEEMNKSKSSKTELLKEFGQKIKRG